MLFYMVIQFFSGELISLLDFIILVDVDLFGGGRGILEPFWDTFGAFVNVFTVARWLQEREK